MATVYLNFLHLNYPPPPSRSHHTVNTVYRLVYRCLPGEGMGLCAPPQAKGTSLLLLLHSLRKCGYCSASTAVTLKCDCWGREGHQGGLGMAKSITPQAGWQAPSRSRISTLLCNHTGGKGERAVEWCRPVILMLGQSRQEHQKFKVIPSYTASLKPNSPPHPRILGTGGWFFLVGRSFCRSTLAKSKAPHISNCF